MKQKPGTVSRTRARVARARAVSPRTLRLGSALTLREVSHQAQALRRLLAARTPRAARLDARELTSVDTAGVQLLVAAAAAVRRQGRKLQLLGGERVLEGAAAALGLRAPLLEMLEVLP